MVPPKKFVVSFYHFAWKKQYATMVKGLTKNFVYFLLYCGEILNFSLKT